MEAFELHSFTDSVAGGGGLITKHIYQFSLYFYLHSFMVFTYKCSFLALNNNCLFVYMIFMMFVCLALSLSFLSLVSVVPIPNINFFFFSFLYLFSSFIPFLGYFFPIPHFPNEIFCFLFPYQKSHACCHPWYLY